MKKIFFTILIIKLVFIATPSWSQDTQIRGFVDVLGKYETGDKLSFGFGEQDLFITSVLSDRISFLGETVFKFDPLSHSEFSISVERVIIDYNLKGNNDLLMGKVHTPLNYWNDTYHHGRLFFPTIERPLLFKAEIIPIHTVGVGVRGHDLGDLRFGYDLYIGNGIGSEDVKDNDKNKSISMAVHVKPAGRLRLGLSWYNDVISNGADLHGRTLDWKVKQNLLTASVSTFGKKVEILAEGTAGFNKTDTTGVTKSFASYVYAGYKVTPKVIPYLRYDYLHFQEGEIYYNKNNVSSVVAGIRIELNYLAVVKLEYQYEHSELSDNTSTIMTQFAIGF
ncbi:hypothetical protein [Mangrovibacterium lignilyticum]|uniref:hypothetical protein n=1 Tax=Mangrovibacterium lignilyticum TaxID=2668052 RepID=UPI0013D71BCE|nr:hypothetical protein [Mangrovibacterium lignilyticum]